MVVSTLEPRRVYSSLVSYTDQPELEYRVGVSNAMQRFTEMAVPTLPALRWKGHAAVGGLRWRSAYVGPSA